MLVRSETGLAPAWEPGPGPLWSSRACSEPKASDVNVWPSDVDGVDNGEVHLPLRLQGDPVALGAVALQ